MTLTVMWSGGLDSTLLLHEKATNFPNETINALTVLSVGNHTEQSKEESKARGKLKKLLPKNIKYHNIEVNTTLSHQSWQMPIWLAYAIPHIQNEDTLFLAYLSSDGFTFWEPKTNLENAFNSHMKLLGRPDSKIEFPFECMNKGNVIKRLKGLKLLKHCWYCGSPKNKKTCGKCMKCMSMKRWGKFPDDGETV